MKINKFFPLMFISTKKNKLTSVSCIHPFKQAYLEVHIWNIGLITFQLYTKSDEKPNKSYKWISDKWKYKTFEGNLREIVFKIVEGFYLANDSNFVKKALKVLPLKIPFLHRDAI